MASRLKIRREAASIEAALAKLERRWATLFTNAYSMSGDGDPVKETAIGIGQALAYICAFRTCTDAAIDFAILQHAPATSRRTGRITR